MDEEFRNAVRGFMDTHPWCAPLSWCTPRRGGGIGYRDHGDSWYPYVKYTIAKGQVRVTSQLYQLYDRANPTPQTPPYVRHATVNDFISFLDATFPPRASAPATSESPPDSPTPIGQDLWGVHRYPLPEVAVVRDLPAATDSFDTVSEVDARDWPVGIPDPQIRAVPSAQPVPVVQPRGWGSIRGRMTRGGRVAPADVRSQMVLEMASSLHTRILALEARLGGSP